MSSRTNIFFLFWLPSQAPQPYNIAPDHMVVPMSRHFFSLSYPTLSQAIQSVSPGAGEYAIRLTSQFEGDLNQQIKPYLICRMLFLFMMFLCVLLALLYTFVYGEMLVSIWDVVFLVIWMIVCRLVMNSMGYALYEYASLFRCRLAEMIRTMLGAQDIKIDTGVGMAWLEVYRDQYQPPVQGYGVPIGIAV